jgi:hypothetical protein
VTFSVKLRGSVSSSTGSVDVVYSITDVDKGMNVTLLRSLQSTPA